jgi:putative glycosyltransferase (TIGR04372 family)
VRDSAYKEIHQPLLGTLLGKDWSYHDYRNCDINTYNKASLELAKKGYWVIRMGNGVREKFNTTHSHIFDYATSEYRSDFLDLWLMANCHFAVSTGTGLDSVSDIFRRPVVYANYDSMKALVMWSNSISVPKRLFHELERRYLTITESLDHSYTHSNLYRKNFIRVVDLNEDEIRDAVMEMEARLSNSWVDSERDKELQKFFMNIYTSWHEYPRHHGWINPEAFIGSSYLKNMPESFFK